MSLTVPSAFDEAPNAITLVRGVILAAMIGFIEPPGFQQPHLLDDHALIGKAQPGTAIGLMIELGDEHLIALLQGAGDGAAQGIIQRGHVLTKRDAVRILGAEEIGENARAPPPCAGRLLLKAKTCRAY